LKKLLNIHLEHTLSVLKKQSEALNIAKHSKTIGDAREAIISNFLKKNLPSFVDYHDGELFDSENKRSGQIDIILHPITSPKINLVDGVNMFPIETVLAGIEVKSKLTTGKTGSFFKALNSCKKAKILNKINRPIDFNDIELSTIPFIIFAFNGPKKETVISSLKNYIELNENKSTYIYKYLPDMIVVLDGKNETYVIYKTKNWIYAGQNFEDIFKYYDEGVKLLAPFKLLNSLVELWSCNIVNNRMPINDYASELEKKSIFDFLVRK